MVAGDYIFGAHQEMIRQIWQVIMNPISDFILGAINLYRPEVYLELHVVKVWCLHMYLKYKFVIIKKVI